MIIRHPQNIVASAASVTISGLTQYSAFNGEYVANGTANGKPTYYCAANGKYGWWDSVHWLLTDSVGALSNDFYWQTSSADALPTGSWTADVKTWDYSSGSGSWTAPWYCVEVQVECWGSGGGGGRSTS